MSDLGKAHKRMEHPLSAQEYNSLSEDEKDDLLIAATEDNQDPDEWKRKQKKLWPKKFTPKPLVWRDR